MPVVSLNVSNVIGKTLIADGNVDYFNRAGGLSNGATKLGTFKKGETIGIIYRHAYGNSPNIYWQIDKVNTSGQPITIFVKHDVNNLILQNGKQILQDIKDQQDKAKYEEVGAFRYYLEKYLPYAIGIAAVAFIVPPLLRKK